MQLMQGALRSSCCCRQLEPRCQRRSHGRLLQKHRDRRDRRRRRDRRTVSRPDLMQQMSHGMLAPPVQQKGVTLVSRMLQRQKKSRARLRPLLAAPGAEASRNQSSYQTKSALCYRSGFPHAPSQSLIGQLKLCWNGRRQVTTQRWGTGAGAETLVRG
jgi:hypothetical protein